ncbi:hypothetical protein [Algoriphagus sp. AK58]|uniref:hypothetical protein n=1 Tax=Algoriphagus sp. AK58 TaxID=1406877 RepID=UPI00164F03E4|nr:hypothetical protein [Algoriphagus sp. AK58]MBC6366829.1 hypothetical protein [Algoriphagus sp. AK58]
MDTILKKMNFKEGMKIRIWNCPQDLEDLVNSWKTSGYYVEEGEKPTFMLAFVYSKEDIDEYFEKMHQLSPEDEAIWVAYPKGTSKKYKVSINRDSGWRKVGELDYEGVRQIAIDEDWSALRFRKVRFIKTLSRKFSAKNQ